MTTTLGPLDAAGRIPSLQQTRIASFLISAHGAEARLLTAALANPMSSPLFGTPQIELHAQLCREMEIVSLLSRATSWQPDPMLIWLVWRWESAWLPQPVQGLGNLAQGPAIDAAAFGYALHTAIRPAVLLPEHSPMSEPFAAALRRIEIEGGRIVQAQLRFLKSPELGTARDAISAAVDRRYSQLRQLWAELLSGMGVNQES
ncbi:MAG TPA: hypothetical protein VKI44_26575 [Acetobacteraceae bacterium]|nr:hypothetical protein [Acetobacteraceae bacterium]